MASERPADWRGAVRGRVAAVAQGLSAYGLIVRMWVRSSLAYRTSFVLMACGNFAANALDFVAIMLMFSQIDALGGFSLPEVAFLYGTSGVALGLADLALGSIEGLGRRVRDGTLDTLLLRPAPVFAQMAADRFALRRLGRITQALLVLGWSLPRIEVDWTVGRVLLVPLMAVCGTAIFAAVYTAGAAFQFWAQDAAEVQNSFTYGGNAMLQYPPTVFAKELVRGVTFLVPLAFVNWLPALRLLGHPDPLGLPGWVDFLGPVVAALMCTGAGLVWRLGLRAYRSTGS
ncbi:ABC-2 type transport system permease protein [Streptomyces sp. 2333.5]|nr:MULTISPECIES: ABC transporter permease [unclassified Streptomyces]PJJ02199.1 ABC-2 type transport system permease protein [Streptomyces sp. 2333.5]SEC99808.1 ABC-2 type transport system permease protein [Streptomyces sp. 2314.4]SED85937.1 ABC-2 type transport system permease protein [Streptomyces sp. 2112.2]